MEETFKIQEENLSEKKSQASSLRSRKKSLELRDQELNFLKRENTPKSMKSVSEKR